MAGRYAEESNGRRKRRKEETRDECARGIRERAGRVWEAHSMRAPLKESSEISGGSESA